MFKYEETDTYTTTVTFMYPDKKGVEVEQSFKVELKHLTPEEYEALQTRMGDAQQKLLDAIAGEKGGDMAAVVRERRAIAEENLVGVSGIGDHQGNEYSAEKQLGIVRRSNSLMATVCDVIIERNNSAKKGNSEKSRRR